MLEEKLDILTKEIVALRKAVEANTAAGGATAPAGAPTADDTTAKPAAKRGRPAKAEVVEPEHTAAEVEEVVRRVSKEIGRPQALKIIKGFKGCDALADLLQHPEFFDAAFDAANEALDAAAPAEEEEEEL
jgi:hypothetical protein